MLDIGVVMSKLEKWLECFSLVEFSDKTLMPVAMNLRDLRSILLRCLGLVPWNINKPR